MNVGILKLHPRQEFRTSRTRASEIKNVLLRVELDGVAGWGEGSPISFYGESAEEVVALLEGAADWIAGLRIHCPGDIEKAWAESWSHLAPSRAAQCALDLALWDLLGRKLGITVCELVHGHKPRPVPSFCTIGLSTAEELNTKVAELRDYPLIKIKSDRAADLGVVDYVRQKCSGKIAVDANCAWGPGRLEQLCIELRKRGVLFVEQPLAPGEGVFRGSYALPVIADESCVLEGDLPRVANDFDGYNIKLVKCGGLTPALRMLRAGMAMGLRVLVGCMLESSLLISAAAVVAQHSDYADLDGAWLLADDPFTGLQFEKGVLRPSPAPGFGVALSKDA